MPALNARRISRPGTPWSYRWPRGYDQNGLLAIPGAWASECGYMLTDPELLDQFNTLKSALLAGQWKVLSSAEGDAEADRNAEFVRSALGLEGRPQKADSSWEEIIARLAPRAIAIGFMPAEPVYRFDGGQVLLKDVYDIEPASIVEFRRNEHGLDSIVQDLSRDGRMTSYRRPIPADRLIMLVPALAGDLYTGGGGILRACHYWWKLKIFLAKQMGIGAQRWANPSPVRTVDRVQLRSAAQASGTDVESILSASAEALNGWESSETMWLEEFPGLTYRIIGESTFDPEKVITAIRHCDEQMSKAWAARFKEIGISGEGSRAIGEVHYDSWRSQNANRMDYFASALRRVIVDLVRWNFYMGDTPPADKVPFFSVAGLEVNGLGDGLGNVVALTEADVLTKTPGLEAGIRRLMGLKAEPGTDRPASERRPPSGAVIPRVDGGAGRPEGS